MRRDAGLSLPSSGGSVPSAGLSVGTRAALAPRRSPSHRHHHPWSPGALSSVRGAPQAVNACDAVPSPCRYAGGQRHLEEQDVRGDAARLHAARLGTSPVSTCWVPSTSGPLPLGSVMGPSCNKTLILLSAGSATLPPATWRCATAGAEASACAPTATRP